jgi:hypothetical protein
VCQHACSTSGARPSNQRKALVPIIAAANGGSAAPVIALGQPASHWHFVQHASLGDVCRGSHAHRGRSARLCPKAPLSCCSCTRRVRVWPVEKLEQYTRGQHHFIRAISHWDAFHAAAQYESKGVHWAGAAASISSRARILQAAAHILPSAFLGIRDNKNSKPMHFKCLDAILVDSKARKPKGICWQQFCRQCNRGSLEHGRAHEASNDDVPAHAAICCSTWEQTARRSASAMPRLTYLMRSYDCAENMRHQAGFTHQQECMGCSLRPQIKRAHSKAAARRIG